MRRLLLAGLLLVAVGASVVPFVTLIGLGAHRHAAPLAVSASAILLVYVPAAIVAGTWRAERAMGAIGTLLAWSLALFLVFPVYFPGERRQGLATGIGLLGLDTGWLGWPARLAETLPDEPEVAKPEVPEATVVEVPDLPPAAPTSGDQIALPYEGEGRRLAIPVLFEHAGREVEVEMMLDTGATYTTLDRGTLSRLGLTVPSDAPTIDLHTANGLRTSEVVLVDAVWLGDLATEGVALAVCDDCTGEGTVGLLGLNVSGGYNLHIDADRREVTFAPRASFDRALDVKPFVDLDASFTRFPGGRVEVAVTLANHAPREVLALTTSVRCDGAEWSVQLRDIGPGIEVEERRKLPRHEACDQYQIGVLSARW